jgi:hypothetical protein
MAINLYSKDSTDTLLAAKLSDAPIDGSTYGRKDGAWEVVSGGGGVAWGAITGTLSTQTDLQTELDNKASLSSPAFSGTTTFIGSGGTVSLNEQALDMSASTAGGHIIVGTSGITFSDSTTQTTAAVAGANYGDAFTLGKVQDVSPVGGYWLITFAPINAAVIETGISVSLSDGSLAEDVTGSGSTTSVWTYLTTGLTSSDYIYITVNGQRSTITISQP